MRGLRLAAKLLVPDLTTETLGIIGKRGSGKSHTGTLLVRLSAAGVLFDDEP